MNSIQSSATSSDCKASMKRAHDTEMVSCAVTCLRRLLRSICMCVWPLHRLLGGGYRYVAHRTRGTAPPAPAPTPRLLPYCPDLWRWLGEEPLHQTLWSCIHSQTKYHEHSASDNIKMPSNSTSQSNKHAIDICCPHGSYDRFTAM